MAELKIIRMSDIRSEPVDWLWKPYLPSGAISLIQGDGAMGKTTVSLAIAAAVTRGDALPGCGKTFPANVIIQNSEDSYTQTIRPRLEQLGADCEMIHVIDEDEQALSLSDTRIEQAIIRTNAKLILLDPVQAYLNGANMNSANGIRPLMKNLGTVAARHGCSILLVGHLNKKSGKAQYAGLGSIDIYAAARSVLTVGCTNIEENIRAIVHNKSNLAPAGKSQSFALDPISGFAWMGECNATIEEVLGKKKKPESQFAKARQLLESTLANDVVPAVTIMETAEELGISPKTLNRAKDALGVVSVKRGAQWYWLLPIEVEYSEVSQDGQEGHAQHSQDGQREMLTNLTTFPGEVQNMKEGC